MSGTGGGYPVNPLTGLTRQEIGTAVREFLNEVGSTYMTGTVVNNAIDRAARKLNSDTEYNRSTYDLYVGTSSRRVEMLGDVETVYRVTWGSGKEKIRPCSKQELDRDDPDWETATGGTPGRYWFDGVYIGFDKQVTVGTYIHIDCLRTPTKLTTNTAVPSWCPTRYHDTIAKYAALTLAGGFDVEKRQSSNPLQMLYTEYVEEVKKMSALSSNRSREKAPRITFMGYDIFRR